MFSIFSCVFWTPVCLHWRIYTYVFQVIILYTFHLHPIIWWLPSNKVETIDKKTMYREKNFCKCKGKKDRNNNNGSLKYISQLLILEMVIWTKSNGEKLEVVTDFIFLGSKIPVDNDCSHEIKRHLLFGRKVITNLVSVLKNRDITLPTKVHIVKAVFFPVVKYGCES